MAILIEVEFILRVKEDTKVMSTPRETGTKYASLKETHI